MIYRVLDPEQLAPNPLEGVCKEILKQRDDFPLLVGEVSGVLPLMETLKGGCDGNATLPLEGRSP